MRAKLTRENNQGLDSSRRQKNKLPWLSCNWSHDSSEMGVGRPVNTELFGCCPLPSRVSALSFSFGSKSTTACGFQHHSRRAVPFSACSTSPAPLDFACFQEKVLRVNGVSWLRLCRAKPIHCLLELGQPSCPLGSFAATSSILAL